MTKQQFRAVLWDMDGTLLDSAEYHWIAWRDALAAEGHPITYDQFQASFGQRNDTILRGHYGPDLADDEIRRIGDLKEEQYREMVRTRGVALLPGVEKWLIQLHKAGWRQAIATAAPKKNATTIVKALNIEPYIDALTSAEDVQHGKPDPQVFLMAAERVGVPPSRCIVVEDAPAGLEGARRAGMRTIGVRSSHTDLQADIVVDTLEELDEEAFDQLHPR
ncbi:MAG: Beta-phosphoglucomutase [Chloroflexi bacterium AL-W]|nr:Beta-phosphoglucomutase [Chloroflexi bacterium AL-N1]NOK68584.1 Beta-phosphoglucomutase [Chloroflexi bacterium AL-N10]NOK76070.1 Beta-phosphoglucomutase [Chloroflexi bacterium AL-N5]NOK82543.1 Beta-phosphoglucomutase [Chloroflexi bacterium AL-W]NOK92853.1 Beta-phosphoglucomutase [Chloroflexi bacterium AL-N15]